MPSFVTRTRLCSRAIAAIQISFTIQAHSYESTFCSRPFICRLRRTRLKFFHLSLTYSQNPSTGLLLQPLRALLERGSREPELDLAAHLRAALRSQNGGAHARDRAAGSRHHELALLRALARMTATLLLLMVVPSINSSCVRLASCLQPGCCARASMGPRSHERGKTAWCLRLGLVLG